MWEILTRVKDLQAQAVYGANAEFPQRGQFNSNGRSWSEEYYGVPKCLNDGEIDQRFKGI